MAWLRTCGTQRLVATVLAENGRMLELARGMGFAIERDPQDPALRLLSLVL